MSSKAREYATMFAKWCGTILSVMKMRYDLKQIFNFWCGTINWKGMSWFTNDCIVGGDEEIP